MRLTPESSLAYHTYFLSREIREQGFVILNMKMFSGYFTENAPEIGGDGEVAAVFQVFYG
jgi:hypothetical protein